MFDFYVFGPNEKQTEADFFTRSQIHKVDKNNKPVVIVVECSYISDIKNKTLCLAKKLRNEYKKC